MSTPRVRFARSGEVDIAYQVMGDGPVDLVWVEGFLAVHIGARVGGLASAGEILVSQTVRDMVAGSGLELADRGTHALKGVPGEWRVFAVA